MIRKAVYAILFAVSLLFVSMVFLNFLSYGILVGYSEFDKFMHQGKGSESFQVNLPNYSKDKGAAIIHFEEKGKSGNQYSTTIGWIPKTFHGKSININADGNRVHKIHEGNLLIKQSVYFFGGSTIWGFGAWDNETIPALFGSIANFPSYNMGQQGWVSRQGLARFINLLSQEAKIDIAIFYDGYNDVTVGCRVELKPGDHSRAKEFQKRITKKSTIGSWEFLEFLTLTETKKLAAAIRRKLIPSTVEKNLDKSLICDNSEERAREVASTLVNNWQIAHDIAIARSIQFYAILHPTGFIGTPKVDHLQHYYSDPGMKEIAKQMQVVYPMIQEIVQERKLDWIFDYTEAFSRDEYIYIGGVHVSPNGNQIIAEQLYRDIFERQN